MSMTLLSSFGRWKRRRTERRRLTAASTAFLLLASLLVVGSGALGGYPAAKAEPAWTCDAFGYLFQSPAGVDGPHDIFQIDLATGESTHYASTPDAVNGVAYNPLDNYFYGWSGIGEFVRINADGSADPVGNPTGNDDGYNIGDFDSSGHLWVTRSIDGAAYYEIDYAPGSPTYGQIVSQGTFTYPAGLTFAGADWAWIGGYLYSVGYGPDGMSHLVRFDPATQTATDMGALPMAQAPFGAVYADADGNLWASDNATGAIYRINPTTLDTVKVSDGPISGGNDGARCASAPIPTITVTKQVPARVQAADQFTVGLRDSGGAVLTSATTTGADTTVSTTNWPVSQGKTYTITDAMAPGSPDALSAYIPTIECVDTATGSPVQAAGTAPNWTMTVTDPTDYACTVTNTPGEPSFEVEKTASTAGPVSPGDTVTYTVTATNTSTVPYTEENPATFSDDLSGVLDDATYNDDATSGATVDGTTLNWSGPLGVGETVTITYSVTIDDPVEGDHELSNVVIGGENCPEGSTAPECGPPPVPVLSYETVKTVDATRVEPGQTVTYTVTVTNTGKGAYTEENPASFTDNLSAVLDDATYNGDASSGATVDGETLSWSGPLAVGEKVTITYSFTVNDPDEGDQQLSNAVVTPPNVGGNCPEGTDNPDCVTEVPGTKLDVEKTASADEAVPGDTVTYTVKVTNTGKADFTDEDPASFTDDLSKVLDDATYNGDADNGATVDGNKLSWSGPLAVGETVTITYSVTVDSPPAGDRELENVVTTPPGMNGNCGEGSTDPACATHTDVRSFEVVKKASTGEAAPGEKVTYTVQVTNTGKLPYTEDKPASFTDDLSKVLDDATYNGDADNGATVDGSTLSWSGPLDVGESVTITYSVTVKDPMSGDGNLHNVVTTPPGSGGEETGGNCPEGTDNPDCQTDTAVKKPGSPGTKPQEPGDKGGSGIKPVSKPSGGLAYTGADLQLVLILAGLLLVAGVTLLTVSRLRRRSSAE